MIPSHYAVPEGLDIKLIGYVRWAWKDDGHHVTTLWRDSSGQYFYYEDLWTPFSAPFWFGVGMKDLVPCTADEFISYTGKLYQSIEDPEESLSAHYRLHELMTVCGVLEGTDIGFRAWAAQNRD